MLSSKLSRELNIEKAATVSISEIKTALVNNTPSSNKIQLILSIRNVSINDKVIALIRRRLIRSGWWLEENYPVDAELRSCMSRDMLLAKPTNMMYLKSPNSLKCAIIRIYYSLIPFRY